MAPQMQEGLAPSNDPESFITWNSMPQVTFVQIKIAPWRKRIVFGPPLRSYFLVSLRCNRASQNRGF
jgi:hypothetical protein